MRSRHATASLCAALLAALAGLPAAAAGPVVDRLVRVTPGAVLVGATWSSGTPAVSVRTRTAAGWSGWSDLEVDAAADPGTPEAARVRPGTEPYWLPRGAGLVEVRATGPVHGLGVALVTGSGGTTASSAPAATVTLPRLGAVVTRAGWSADEHLRSGRPSYAAPAAVVVHHTVTANDYTPAEAASYVRAVYAYHTRSRGYSDIGYNLLVDRFGTVYEGRYGGFARGVVGAHTAGFNTGTLGVALLGDYDTADVTPVVADALARVGAWAADRWRFDPRGTVTLRSRGSPRYGTGRVTVRRMPGHRDLGYTACPGAHAYAALPDIRTAAWHKLAAVFAAPVVTGAPVHAPDPVIVRSTLDHVASWAATIAWQGHAVATATGTGRDVAVSWDGEVSPGVPAPPGMSYDYTLTADDGVHGPSDPATGTVDVGLPKL